MEPWVPALTARCNGPTHLGHSLLDYHDHIGHESDWITVVHRKAYRRWSTDPLASVTSSCFWKSQYQDLGNKSELIGSDDNDTSWDINAETEAFVDTAEEWFPVAKGLQEEDEITPLMTEPNMRPEHNVQEKIPEEETVETYSFHWRAPSSHTPAYQMLPVSHSAAFDVQSFPPLPTQLGRASASTRSTVHSTAVSPSADVTSRGSYAAIVSGENTRVKSRYQTLTYYPNFVSPADSFYQPRQRTPAISRDSNAGEPRPPLSTVACGERKNQIIRRRDKQRTRRVQKSQHPR